MNPLLELLAKENQGVTELERIYHDFAEREDFVAHLISAMRQLDPEHSCCATWLLARAARDQRISAPELVRIAEGADGATHWVVRLTLCQLFATTGCPGEVRELIHPFLVESFGDRRVIVRAWAISALATYADDPAYGQQIAGFMRSAKNDPGKSMQARLRHLAAGAKKRAARGGTK